MNEKALTKTGEKVAIVASLFEAEAIQDQLRKTVPSILNVDTLVRVSLHIIRTNPGLLECSQKSLLACVLGAGILGLSPEPYLGQVYFVPFNTKRGDRWIKEATLIPGYRGYVTLARRSGELASLAAQAVYEKDHFVVQWGLHEALDHVPAEGDRGAFKGAWTVFKYLSGGDPTFEYMPKADIEAIMNRSKAKNSGPWVTDFSEMAKKTVIRRHMKLAPLSVEDNRLMQAAAAEDLALGGGDQTAFFLPDHDAPLEIEAGGGGGTASFAETFADIAGHDAMPAYLDALAKGNGDATIDEAKAMAVDNQEAFRNGFDRYRATHAKKVGATNAVPDPNNHRPGYTGRNSERTGPQSAPPTDQETGSGNGPQEGDVEFMNEWFRLQKENFEKYVIDNWARFASASPFIQEKVRSKWERLVETPFPENAPTSPTTDDQAPPTEDPPESGSDDTHEAGPPALEDSDEYAELMALKRKHFQVFAEVSKGRVPDTLGKVKLMVLAIQEAVGAAE